MNIIFYEMTDTVYNLSFFFWETRFGNQQVLYLPPIDTWLGFGPPKNGRRQFGNPCHILSTCPKFVVSGLPN